MRRVDREALQRAIQTVKADPAERRWIIDKIRDQGWEDAALSAVYHCQVTSLHLKPWQEPPCWAGDDKPVDDHTHGRVEAWELRRRLIKAGLSMYEPDPVRALETVAARQRDRTGNLAPNGAKPDTRPPF